MRSGPGKPFLQQGLLMWGGKPVPKWAYSAETCEMVQHHSTHLMMMAKCMRPVWKYAVGANVVLWTFALVFPGFVAWGSLCDEHGFAKGRLWLWALYVPPLIVSMYCEIKAYRLVLPAYVKVLGCYTFFGKEIPFKVWFGVVLGLSVISDLDLATSGFFLGRLIHTYSCKESLIPHIWDEVVSRSYVPFLPSLCVLGFVAWSLMFIQIVLALMYGIPAKRTQLAALMAAKDHVVDHFELVSTLLSGDSMGQFECDITAPLYDSARMVLISFRETSLVRNGYAKDVRMLGTRRTLSLMAERLAVRANAKFLFETSLQANLQASALGLTFTATHVLDPMIIISLILSFLTSIYNFTMASRMMIAFDRLVRPNCDPAQNDEDVIIKRRLNRSIVIFGLGVLSCTLMTSYASVKTLAALMLCQNEVWNVGGWVNQTDSNVSMDATLMSI